MKSPANASYARLTPAQRIDVIYKATILNLNVAAISRETGIKYNTIRNILFTYYRTGRTNKLTYAKNKPWFKPEKKGAKKNLIGRDITSLTAIKASHPRLARSNEPAFAKKDHSESVSGHASEHASTTATSPDLLHKSSAFFPRGACPAKVEGQWSSLKIKIELEVPTQKSKFCNLAFQPSSTPDSSSNAFCLGLHSSEAASTPGEFQNSKERAWEIVPSDVMRYEKETEMQNCIFIGPLSCINAYVDGAEENWRTAAASILPQPISNQ